MTVGQHGGSNRDLLSPAQTLTASVGDQNAIVAPFAIPRYGEAAGQAPRSMSFDCPASTIVPTGNGASLVAPLLDVYHNPRPDGTVGRASELHEPARTVDTQNRFSMVQAFLAQHNTGMVGHPADKPMSTIVGRGTQQQLVEVQAAGFLSHSYTSNTSGGNGNPGVPLKTVVAGGQHHMAVKAFLQAYYGSGFQGQAADSPLRTASTRDRLGVITVDEVDYEIVDIGMRMLTARELFRAQGFPESYQIDVVAANKRGKLRPLPKDAQVRMCGNSVCPDVAAALVGANCGWLKIDRTKRAPERQLELAGV